MTFNEYCTQNGLDILTADQTKQVLASVQRHGCADAKRLAILDNGLYGCVVAVEGGNLGYYAGLEYCEEQIELKTRKFTAYLFNATSIERDNGTPTVRLYDACVAAMAGEEVVF
jgi:hypothetical protein